jgi:CheY-like chemotaxis protein
VMMPEMDGFEVVRHMKSVNADIPVLVISGEPRNRFIDVLSQAKKLGADQVLSKGDIQTNLVAIVAEMLLHPSGQASHGENRRDS